MSLSEADAIAAYWRSAPPGAPAPRAINVQFDVWELSVYDGEREWFAHVRWDGGVDWPLGCPWIQGEDDYSRHGES